MNATSLSHKTAIVTGGARGIGRAIVKAFAVSGADVVIGDLLSEEADALATEIQQQTGRRMVVVRADVTQLQDANKMRDVALREFGKIDILVNDAGWDRLTPFLKSSPDVWEKIIDINYRGVLHTCYAVLPNMVERKQGTIINISSDSARVGSLGEAVYSGAKAAVIAFSKTLAREHARDNIRVNTICPGLVETSLLNEIREEQFGQKILSSVVNQIPLKRLAQPEDIAPMVVFLASDDARYITGQVTSVNGGLTMVG
jgi:2-hydroxycyclohexanecarboxyl-CoA dehydrogenase